MKHISMGKIRDFKTLRINIAKSSKQFLGVEENEDGTKIPIFDNNQPLVHFKGTVKIHGTNSGIILDGETIYAQSRKHVLTPEGKDNAGFSAWVKLNEPVFKELFEQIKQHETIEDDEIITIYGEWSGSGIQKSMAINQISKFLAIFAVKITKVFKDEAEENVGRWLKEFSYLKSPENRIFNINNFKTYEIDIDFNNPNEAITTMEEYVEEVAKECPVAKKLEGIIGDGEGIVWVGWLNEKRHVFKTKVDVHAASKQKNFKPKIEIDPAKLESIEEFIKYACNEDRLTQMLNETLDGEMQEMKHMGSFLKSVWGDIIAEELETLTANGLSPADIRKIVPNYSKKWFITKYNMM